jgi:hypothetical protein
VLTVRPRAARWLGSLSRRGRCAWLPQHRAAEPGIVGSLWYGRAAITHPLSEAGQTRPVESDQEGVDVRLGVIAVVIGVLLVSALLAGMVTVGQTLQVAAIAALVTWRVARWNRPSRGNVRR